MVGGDHVNCGGITGTPRTKKTQRCRGRLQFRGGKRTYTLGTDTRGTHAKHPQTRKIQYCRATIITIVYNNLARGTRARARERRNARGPRCQDQIAPKAATLLHDGGASELPHHAHPAVNSLLSAIYPSPRRGSHIYTRGFPTSSRGRFAGSPSLLCSPPLDRSAGPPAFPPLVRPRRPSTPRHPPHPADDDDVYPS